MSTVLRVISSCNSIKPRDALAVRDFEDSFVARQQDDYFQADEGFKQRGEVRKIDSHRTFSAMSSSGSEIDRKV